jgi:hypothetical protein
VGEEVKLHAFLALALDDITICKMYKSQLNNRGQNGYTNGPISGLFDDDDDGKMLKVSDNIQIWIEVYLRQTIKSSINLYY